MKKKLLATFWILGVFPLAQAQNLVNAGFENWVVDTGILDLTEVPVGWETSNLGLGVPDPVLKETDAHSGNFSAALSPISFGMNRIPAFVAQPVAIQQCKRYLNFHSKHTVAATDSFIVGVSFYLGSEGTDVLTFRTGTDTAWTPYHIDLSMASGLTFDTVYLAMAVTGSGNPIALLDDFQFSDTAIGTSFGNPIIMDVKEVNTSVFFANEMQIHPNPAQSQTRLHFTISRQQEVSLTMYDITGKKVWEQLPRLTMPGNQMVQIDVSAFENGIYFCVLQAGSQQLTRKLVVSK